jgi:succinyl-CoA synthetase beta subunit
MMLNQIHGRHDCDSIAQQLNLTEMLTEQFNQTLLSLYEIFTT